MDLSGLRKVLNRLAVPSQIVLTLALAYYSVWVSLELKTARSASGSLDRSPFLELQFLGQKLPLDFQQLMHGIDNNGQRDKRLLLIYSVSTESCGPCVEENVEFFRRMANHYGDAMQFVVFDRVMDRKEAAIMKQLHGIDWPTHFITYEPVRLSIVRQPTVILTSPEGVVLFRWIPEYTDSVGTSLAEMVIEQYLASDHGSRNRGQLN